MDFNNHKAIYLQIVDLCFKKILEQEWKPDERIPSSRDLAIELAVNPNTVMRAYEYLNSETIIYVKRGMGYYVENNALGKIIQIRKRVFFEEILPEIFTEMNLLEISVDEILNAYREFK